MRQIATKQVNPITEAAATADAGVTNAVTGAAVLITTAKKGAVKSQKQLMESPELDEIRSQDGKLKRFIESQSASAGHESTRFVLASEVETMCKAMEAYRTIRRPKLVEDFMAKYEAAEAADFAEQHEALGDQFNRKDYKSSAEVRQGFIFSYTIRNVGKIEVTGLPSWIIDMEAKKEQEQRAEAVTEFKGILRLTFKKLLDTLVDTVKPRIDGAKRKFYDSSVTNLLEFVNNYAKQDMANDAETQALVANIKSVLGNVTPETLKESDNQKAEVFAALSTIQSQLDTMVQVTGRKFR
jgi:hypothetical protein